MEKSQQEIQKQYYSQTAKEYDTLHLDSGVDPEHNIALAFMGSMIELHGIKSILDIGAGTGRAISYLKAKYPNLKVVGIEPVPELREIGYSKGISPEMLIEGDGTDIKFAAGAFDLVCEFGVLHHVPRPEQVVSEMLRVAKVGIFISDSNNFGQGGKLSRSLKQFINLLGLWKVYDYVRTKGKGYQISAGDGLFYSYSAFNNYKQIKAACKGGVQILNTDKYAGINPYSTATHVALFGIKN